MDIDLFSVARKVQEDVNILSMTYSVFKTSFNYNKIKQ